MTQGTKITFAKPIIKTIPAIPERTSSIVEVTRVWIDDGKSVTAQINIRPMPVTLWEGQDYINIGQWTEDQAIARLAEVLAK